MREHLRRHVRYRVAASAHANRAATPAFSRAVLADAKAPRGPFTPFHAAPFEGCFGQGRIQIKGQTLGDGISIQNFNLGKAQGGSGYLGIRLDGKQKSASQTCMHRIASNFIATNAFK